jgi:septum formation protein
MKRAAVKSMAIAVRSRKTPRKRRTPADSGSALPPLILASVSPRRAALLQELGYPFSVVASHAPELTPGFLSPAESAQLNAHRKAAAVACKHPDCLVLAADTVVSAEGVHFGKPATLAEAEAMLTRLQGRVHQVATGLCLMHWAQGQWRIFAETTAVTFRPLRPADIRRYLRSINPLDKAGGYAIQDGGEAIIASIHGSFSNVVGLPTERLLRELTAWQRGRWAASR